MNLLKWSTVSAALVFCFFSAVISPAPLHAEQSPAPALKDILNRTENYYQQIKAYTAHFRQRTMSATASGLSSEASGTLYYQKPRQMRWEYETPEKQTFVASRQYAWMYVPAEKQISLFEGEAFFASPLARTFFDGVFELRKQFEVNLDSRETTQNTAVLNLVPKKEDPHVKSLRLWISLQDYRIVSVETRDAMGNVNRLTIEAQKDAPGLESRIFQLDVPSGTLIMDPEGRQMSQSQIQELQQKINSR